MWLLDTNVWIVYLNSRSPNVRRRMQSLPRRQIYFSDVVKSELIIGAYRSHYTRYNLTILENIFAIFSSLPFASAEAEIAGKLRAELASKGTPIGSYDLLIAATALAHDLTLVTHNVREFERVPDLKLEDWEN